MNYNPIRLTRGRKARPHNHSLAFRPRVKQEFPKSAAVIKQAIDSFNGEPQA